MIDTLCMYTPVLKTQQSTVSIHGVTENNYTLLSTVHVQETESSGHQGQCQGLYMATCTYCITMLPEEGQATATANIHRKFGETDIVTDST